MLYLRTEVDEKKKMSSDQIILWFILVLLLAASAYFSSAETALTTVNRIQLQLLAEGGNKKAKKVIWILDHGESMLSAILIGNNIVNLSASALMTTLVMDLFGSRAVGIATGILTLLVLVFGEIIPKSAASLYALRLSLGYAGSIYILMWILKPLIFMVGLIRKAVLKLMHIDPTVKNSVMTEDELKSLVDVANEDGAIESDEFEMISNVFGLDDTYARDIMTPKPDITFIHIGTSREELMDIYCSTMYTRFPVYSENEDTVIGTINIKDLLTYPKDEEFDLRRMLREPHFTFEHKEVGTLLLEMRANSFSIVIVLDEYGATSGIITFEDILEEIVGEIHDEYDNNEVDPITELKPGEEYLLTGSTSISEFNDAFSMKLSSDDYDTIAGYMIEHLDRLPKNGEGITLEDGTQMIAAIVKRNRVEKVHLILPQEKEEDA